MIAAAAEAEVRRIEARYSRYRADSELSRINLIAAAGGTTDVDAETAGLIAYAKACFQSSAGAFDITSGLLRQAWNFSQARLPEQRDIDALLPRIGLDKVSLSDGRLSFAQAGMELDFGGLGKEYAADRAAEVCSEMGARHGFVDLGGDIRVIGPQADGQPWRIGIRHPRDRCRRGGRGRAVGRRARDQRRLRALHRGGGPSAIVTSSIPGPDGRRRDCRR